MIINNLIFEGTKILRKENIHNPLLDAELLLTPITKKNREFSIIYDKEKIDNKNVSKYFELIDRRKRKEPIAYILNKKEFWSTVFLVDKSVLIPRPDTEVILFDIKERFKNSERLSVLDIGTGSGCILLSILKEFKNYRGVGLDKSRKAINIAKSNSKLLSINNRSKFIKCDVDNYKFDQYYDLIVSNPPYICSHEIKNLSEDVKSFEPIIALDGGITGIVTINKVINKAKKILKIGGHLYLEIGYDQSRKVCHMLKENNFRVIKKLMDYKNKIRCIIGTRLK
tara:strand:- start:614 stop:1462 length:849 start_codon:yes stop_codon:yes gene_type:complete